MLVGWPLPTCLVIFYNVPKKGNTKTETIGNNWKQIRIVSNFLETMPIMMVTYPNMTIYDFTLYEL
jgi:hypothetical protein